MFGKIFKYGAVTLGAIFAGKIIHKKIKERNETTEIKDVLDKEQSVQENTQSTETTSKNYKK